jgi:hypothetical protein
MFKNIIYTNLRHRRVNILAKLSLWLRITPRRRIETVEVKFHNMLTSARYYSLKFSFSYQIKQHHFNSVSLFSSFPYFIKKTRFMISSCPWGPDSSVSIVTKLRSGRPMFFSRQRQDIFLFATASRLALRPAQWVPGVPSSGRSGRGVKLTTHIHLVPRLKMRGGAIPLLPRTSLWRDA